MAKQVLCFEAYFSTGDTDGKTAKIYRKNVNEARDRLELVEKILLDGYTPVRHDSVVINDNPGDLRDE